MDGFDKKVFVRDLKETFELQQITGDDESLNRWIIAPDVNRPGLELAGFEGSNDLKRVILIGNKEMDYISHLDETVLRPRFEAITDVFTPCIIITHGKKAPELLVQIAARKNFPLFVIDQPTYRVAVRVIAYLDEKLAPSDTLHGVMLNINGVGVLLRGESGVGKSELALELINRGHTLVADDRVDMIRTHNSIFCRSPELIKNMIEIRGIGIIDVTKLYGSTSTLDESKLDLVINLVPFSAERSMERLGIEEGSGTNFLGLEIPTMDIPVKEGRAMGVLIETAVANFRLQQQGYNAAKEFDERLMALLIEKGNR